MPDEESTLERLRKRLYANKAVDAVGPTVATSAAPAAPEHWAAPPPPPAAPKARISPAALFLGISLGFFALAGITAGVMLFLGGRSISADRVAVSVEGPATVAGAESVSLLLTVKNENPVAIEGATVTLRFPDGTTEAGDTSVELPQHTEALGDIPAGATVRKTVRATFFGVENQRMTIPITVEYRTSNSNAVFVKKAAYDFTISTSPIGLSITTLSEVTSGQPLTISVLVRSNASTPLKDVAVRAEYPFGFALTGSSPEAVNGNLFVLGDLAVGEEREVRVTGALTGQNGEERVFRFKGGALRSESSREFAATYTEKDAPITIAKPFFAVDVSLGGSEEPVVVAREGDQLVGFVKWANSLETAIRDGAISITLGGEALDPSSVRATNGFYRSSDKTIRFDRDTTQGLALLNPGDTGNGSFTFSTKEGAAMRALRNPTITLSVSVSGRRAGETNVAESVTSTLTRTVKLASELSLVAEAARTAGPYENTGPLPPKVDTESTYSILMSAGNSVNSVAKAKAVMTLPSYVRYVQGEAGVAYDEASRTVTWTIGELAPAGERAAAFQVALLPSSGQQGTSPILVSSPVLSGFDRFVQQEIQVSAPAIDTATAETSGKGIVTP